MTSSDGQANAVESVSRSGLPRDSRFDMACLISNRAPLWHPFSSKVSRFIAHAWISNHVWRVSPAGRNWTGQTGQIRDGGILSWLFTIIRVRSISKNHLVHGGKVPRRRDSPPVSTGRCVAASFSVSIPSLTAITKKMTNFVRIKHPLAKALSGWMRCCCAIHVQYRRGGNRGCVWLACRAQAMQNGGDFQSRWTLYFYRHTILHFKSACLSHLGTPLVVRYCRTATDRPFAGYNIING